MFSWILKIFCVSVRYHKLVIITIRGGRQDEEEADLNHSTVLKLSNIPSSPCRYTLKYPLRKCICSIFPRTFISLSISSLLRCCICITEFLAFIKLSLKGLMLWSHCRFLPCGVQCLFWLFSITHLASWLWSVFIMFVCWEHILKYRRLKRIKARMKCLMASTFQKSHCLFLILSCDLLSKQQAEAQNSKYCLATLK